MLVVIWVLLRDPNSETVCLKITTRITNKMKLEISHFFDLNLSVDFGYIPFNRLSFMSSKPKKANPSWSKSKYSLRFDGDYSAYCYFSIKKYKKYILVKQNA